MRCLCAFFTPSAAASSSKLTLDDFMDRCEGYFGDGGCIIDQPFQPRLPEGMIRCYMGVERSSASVTN